MITEPFLTVYLIHRHQKPFKRFLFFVEIPNHRAKATVLMRSLAPANVASAKVAKRLGEKVEGKTELFGNEVLIYGIARERWLVLRNRSR